MSPDFTPLDRSTPRHPWSDETGQFRVKLQRFSNSPPEFTVQGIDFDRDLQRYIRAAENGQSSCFVRRGPRVQSDEPRSEESIERSQRRAKSQLRKLVTELAPNHFCTFTTRETGPVYFTPDDWAAMWSHFNRLCKMAGIEFEYVAVLERHPTNPLHLHLHVAIRGTIHYAWLRRFWHQAIVWHRDGQRVTRVLRGNESPGNIKDNPVKAPRGSFKQVRKIARYMAKYLTKDLISEFNRKRYWPSKGINLESAQVFWLDALTMSDAVREACSMLGQWDTVCNVPSQKVFNPSERVAWCAIDPDKTPPPPF